MTRKTLKFNNIRVNKKEFYMSKKPIDLMSVNVNQIVVSDKFKYNKDGFKYFIGYQKSDIFKPLCIILPQTRGYIKYRGMNMSFWIKNDEVLKKYEPIWDAIKNELDIKFHIKPVYEKIYLKTKVRDYNGAIKTKFLGNGIPKENVHYTCIACITIDSVMRMEKKNYVKVYLEECKYKTKKTEISRFIKAELDSDSDSESHDNDSDNDSHK